MVGTGEGGDNRLNPREADFLAFYNQGGGIATFNSAQGEDSHLDFLPLDVSLVGGDFGVEENGPGRATRSPPRVPLTSASTTTR